MAKTQTVRVLRKRDVIKATEMPLTKLQNWLDRKLVRMNGGDVPTISQGRARQFSVRTIQKLAIAHRISLLGIPANIAVTLAAKFSDKPQRGREIGKPFISGKTILIATPDGNGAIINLQPDQDMGSVLTTDTAIVVDIGAIIAEVNSKLMDTI